MTLTKSTVSSGTTVQSSWGNTIQSNSGKELQPKTISITGMNFTSNNSTGYVYWEAGTIYYDGTAFTVSAGNSGADWRDTQIIATLSGGTATISSLAKTSRIQDETKIMLGYCDASTANIRLYVGSYNKLQLPLPEELYDNLINSESDITYSSNTTLTEDILKRDITINTGVTVTTAAVESGNIRSIRCRKLTLSGTAVLTSFRAGAPGGVDGGILVGGRGFNAAGAGGSSTGGGKGHDGGGGDLHSTGAAGGASHGSAFAFDANIFSRKLLAYSIYNITSHGLQNEGLFYGAGGGAGGAGGIPHWSAAGGDGAGGIIIVCDELDVDTNASISANGQNGGSSSSGPYDGGGAGGGGGPIIILCRKCSGDGTIEAEGGVGGTGYTCHGAGGNGGMVYIMSYTQSNPYTVSVAGGTSPGYNGYAGISAFISLRQ